MAGLAILSRSLRAGTTPVVLPPGTFTPAAFIEGAARLTHARRYVSLVPTQLHRVMQSDEALAAARSFAAVLVGGAAIPAELLRTARERGIPVVTSYGMSETAGGCVYDGVPLDGVHVHVDAGRVVITGPTLAAGYLTPSGLLDAIDDSGTGWRTTAAGREFVTSDLGELRDSRLHVIGRTDDVIVCGGRKIVPQLVEAVLERAGLGHAVVVGVPDRQWGEVPVLLVPTGPTSDHPASAPTASSAHPAPTAALPDAPTAALPDATTAATWHDLIAQADLPNHARPRLLLTMDRLPLLASGKVDRAAARELALPHWQA